MKIEDLKIGMKIARNIFPRNFLEVTSIDEHRFYFKDRSGDRGMDWLERIPMFYKEYSKQIEPRDIYIPIHEVDQLYSESWSPNQVAHLSSFKEGFNNKDGPHFYRKFREVLDEE